VKKYIFIALYVLIGIVPYFGTVDKVHSQTLYLSILSFFAVSDIVFTYRKGSLGLFRSLLSKTPILLFLLFFLWSSFTSFFAINFGESIKQLNEIFVLILSLVILTHYISLIKDLQKLILFSILGLCLIELTSIFLPYFRSIAIQGFPDTRGQIYRGITGNINVIAYSLLFKVPFLYYFSQKYKKGFWFFILITTSIFFVISSILETRSAILAILFISICAFLFYLINNKKITKENSLKAFRIVLLPLIFSFLLSSVSSNIFDKRTVTNRVSSLASLEEDRSIGQRFRYFAAAFETIKENPIKGIGIGNWEIESIPFEKNYMDSYIIPYHVHNDYLETAAETGLIGLLLYYGFIFSILILLIRTIFFNNKNKIDKHLLFMILLSFSIYLLDALFNFPFARMVSQMNLIFLVALSINILKINELSKLNKSIALIFLLLMTSLLPVSLYSSARIYNSSKEQAVLFKQFNLNDFTKPSLDVIDKYDMDFLTVGATTIPLLAYKAIYYAEQQKYRDAIEFFQKSRKYNPYLYLSESFLGYAYYKIDELDSAHKYTKLAFYNLPNNLVHYANYLQVLTVLKDSASVNKAFKSVPIKKDTHDELYLLSMSDIVTPGVNKEVFENIDINLESSNNQLKRGFYSVKIGQEAMYEADYYYLLAVELFEQERFENALTNFQRASEINPFELPYKENVANTLIRLQRDDEALVILNELINEDKTESNQSYYLRALILYEKGYKRSACEDFSRLDEVGYLGNNNLYTNLCNPNTIKDSK
jgi:O-antigen ligase